VRRLILLLLLCALPARATYVGGNKSTDTSGTATTITVTYSPTAGNCVVIGLAASASLTVSSIKDNNNTVYQFFGLQNTNNSSDFNTMSVACGIGSGITSFTATFTAGPSLFMGVVEESGFQNFGMFTSNSSASNVAPPGGATLTTQAANNAIVVLVSSNVGAGQTMSSNTGTLRQSAAYGGRVAGMADNTTASAGTSLTASVNWTGGNAPFTATGVELSTSPVNLVQFTGGVCSNAVTCSQAFANPTQIGDYKVVATYDGSSPTANDTFSDTIDTYTQVSVAGHPYCGLATDGDTIAMSYAKVSTNVTPTVTIANGGTTGHKTLLLAEFNGLVASSPLDQVSNCTNTLSVTSLTTGSVTTTVANEVIVAIFGTANGSTFTAGTNYTLLSQQNPAPAAVSAQEFRLLAVAGGYTAAASFTGSAQEAAAFLATFKAASQPVTNFGLSLIGPLKLFGGATSW
jgi:hypothetical protein